MNKEANGSMDKTIQLALEVDRDIKSFIASISLSKPWLQLNLTNTLISETQDIGIRIRPLFFRISFKSNEIHFEEVLPIAGALELIQYSTLVIDDLLDNSPLRNGMKSYFHRHGAAKTVCFGNLLSGAGLRIAGNLIHSSPNLKNRHKAMQRLLSCYEDVYSGQYSDVTLSGNTKIEEDEYFDLIKRTTGSFLQASLVIGALLSGAKNSTVDSFQQFSHFFGLAYQLRDDIIDVIGDEDAVGKPIAADLKLCKARLPVVRALEVLPTSKKRTLKAVLQGESKGTSVQELVELIRSSDAIEYCISWVNKLCELACDNLSKVESSYLSECEHLINLCSLLTRFGHETKGLNA